MVFVVDNNCIDSRTVFMVDKKLFLLDNHPFYQIIFLLDEILLSQNIAELDWLFTDGEIFIIIFYKVNLRFGKDKGILQFAIK
jgi:hypothetical protein